MRSFIVCAAALWIANCATQSNADRRTFVARAIRRSPVPDEFGSGLPKARGLAKIKKPAATTTTAAPAATAATQPPTSPPTTRPHHPVHPTTYPPNYYPQQQQQQQQAYYQNYQQAYYHHQQYPPNYPYQYSPQTQYPPQVQYPPQTTPRPPLPPHPHAQPNPYNPYMPYGYGAQPYPQQQQQPRQQPMMVPVPVPVPVMMPSVPGLSGVPNLLQPFSAPTTTAAPAAAKERSHHHDYATLMPEEEVKERSHSSPTQEEIDAMDRNEVRRAPIRRKQRMYYDDYSEEQTTQATLFPTLPTMSPMKMPTLPPFTLPPSFEKLLGITTPKPRKEHRRKEKRRREYEYEEYEPVKRKRVGEAEFPPHGRSLASREEERGRRDPFGNNEGFVEQREEKDSAPSIANRLMKKSTSHKKNGDNNVEGEEDWLVPFAK